MTLVLLGERHCSHLYQELVQSLEQMEWIGIASRCFAIAGKVKWVTGMN